jgi:signal transduction histidine kinase
LDDAVFRQRHLFLSVVLGLHVPALFAFGVWQGYGMGHSALEIVTPAVCLVFARVARNRRLAAFFVTAGLVFCSSVLVHLSGGTIEAHFHFFILIGLIALYQDWVPFLWNVMFTVLSHGIGSTIGAALMFNHDAAQNQPWSWAAIHGVSVLAACVGVIIFWKNTELEQQRGVRLAEELAEAELSAARAEAAQRRSVSELFVHLARRNQTLLDRQLALIGDLEQRERAPEALGELFQLDHLATRIRRNAESLLVLSGDDPPRRWGRPVALGEVVRAAAAEVEDFARVEVLVDEHLEVAGRVVADLAHLLAELIENATNFSPPSNEVRVRSHLVPSEGSTFVISVEDTGVGMPDADVRAANALLADPPDVDLTKSRLGFHVVSRLARRYGLAVRLHGTPGGGVTALVTLPDDLVSERRGGASPVAAGLAPAGATSARSRDTNVWTVPDAETLARLVVPPGTGPNGDHHGRPALPSSTGAYSIAPPWAGAARMLARPSDPNGDDRRVVIPPGGRVSSWSLRDPARLAAEAGMPDPAVPPPPPAQGLSGAPTPTAGPNGGSAGPHGGPGGPGGPNDGSGGPSGPNGGPGGPQGAPGPLTADGLVRRVPGAGLAPALRRRSLQRGPGPSPATPDAPDPAASGFAGFANPADSAGARPSGTISPRDHGQVRSMLSRFQSSQRAGRAAASQTTDETPIIDPAPEDDA